MSHQPERKEKNCLNCGAQVHGRFCHVCGQENLVPKQSARGLVTHFIYDVLHFDGKFFSTLVRLLFKPGSIPKEYVNGRRVAYLDPIRMYLFTSALFFLVFFSLENVTHDIIRTNDTSRFMTKVERLEYASVLHRQLETGKADSTTARKLAFLLDTAALIRLRDSLPQNSSDSSFLIRLGDRAYLMQVTAFDPKKELANEGNFLNKGIRKKWNNYRRKFADDDRAFLAALGNSILHKLPYLLFLSLPFFALLLKFFYWRRKKFYYSDHAVFTLYHYIFTFILILLYLGLVELYLWLHWGVLRFLAVCILLSGGVYLLLSMKRFYGQGWGKTTVKFLLLNVFALITLLILSLGFIVFSLIQI